MFPGGSGSVNNVNLDILITKNRRDMTIDGQGEGRGGVTLHHFSNSRISDTIFNDD